MRALSPLALLLALLVLAAPAGAATVEATAGAGPAAEEYLYFRAAGGERNRLTITETRTQTIFTDTGARLRVKGDDTFGVCRNTSRHRVVCPRFDMVVDLRDGKDRGDFSRLRGAGSNRIPDDPVDLIRVYEDFEGANEQHLLVTGGAGNDTIIGSRHADTIIPGDGLDRVLAGAGADEVISPPDGDRDVLRGEDGLNELSLRGNRAVTLSTATGVMTAAGGERDSLKGFRRIFGSGRDDTLSGGSAGEALYGEGGVDRLEGNGGGDLLVGDGPFVTEASFRNTFDGGPGSDLLDARSFAERATPGSLVACGDGADRYAGDPGTEVDAACERVAFRINTIESEDSAFSPFWDVTSPIAPVARGADGAPTYQLSCPRRSFNDYGRCTGNVFLERPAAPNDRLGSGAYDIPAGESRNVAVALNDAGRAALAPGAPVRVHVVGNVALREPVPGRELDDTDFGWQTAF